jgi:hypothetical protein
MATMAVGLTSDVRASAHVALRKYGCNIACPLGCQTKPIRTQYRRETVDGRARGTLWPGADFVWNWRGQRTSTGPGGQRLIQAAIG